MHFARLLSLLTWMPAVHASRSTRQFDVLQPTTRISHCKGQQQDFTTMVDGFPNATFRPMTLIHIPRTGGTTIEDCTMKEPDGEIRWGAKSTLLKGRIAPFGCYGHHVPPNYVPYYDGRETFCVVRNPYERLISQYGFASAFFHSPINNCTVEGLNKYLIKSLQLEKEKPAHSDCHFLPQAAYVWGWDLKTKSLNRVKQSCKRVLRFENLKEGFNQLMTESGYPYRLPDKHDKRAMDPNTKSPKKCHNLHLADLSEDVLQLADDVYHDDFELFGYPKAQRPAPISAVQIKKGAIKLRGAEIDEPTIHVQQAQQSQRTPAIPIWVWWNYPHEPSWLVKACIASWQTFAPSPTFEIRFVNASTIHKWLSDVPKEFSRMPYDAATSDLVRAGLLAEHGGVYMDSDVLLMRNLTFITDHLQHADMVSYANSGQNCAKGTFSSNVMAGRKGNALHTAWYKEAKRQLSQHCKLPQSQDGNPAQQVCCYTPSGAERTCHVSWGGVGERIGHPQMKTLLSDGRIRPYCFDEARNEGFAPLLAAGYAKMVDVGKNPPVKSDHACSVEEDNLVCKGFRHANFFNRSAYHLFHAIWPKELQTLGANEMLSGNYVISHLMRKKLPPTTLAKMYRM